jgi:hypothetical protein
LATKVTCGGSTATRLRTAISIGYGSFKLLPRRCRGRRRRQEAARKRTHRRAAERRAHPDDKFRPVQKPTSGLSKPEACQSISRWLRPAGRHHRYPQNRCPDPGGVAVRLKRSVYLQLIGAPATKQMEKAT